MPVREHLLELMAGDRIEAADGRLLLSSAVLTVLGLVLVEHALTGPERIVEKRFEHLKQWLETRAELRSTEAATPVSEVIRFELDRVFELSVGALVAGFEARRAVA
jgi:hypothetical protein